jgi:predicted Zn-dependent peptidase
MAEYQLRGPTAPAAAQLARELKMLEWEQLKAWRASQLHAGNATLLLMGGLPPGPELRAQLEKVLGSWPGHKGAEVSALEPAARVPPAGGTRTVILITSEKQGPAHLMLWLRWPGSSAWLEAAVDVLVPVLQTQLKQQPAAAGAPSSSSRVLRLTPTWVTVSTQVETPQASEVLGQLVSAVEELRRTDPPIHLVEQARWRMARAQAARFSTSAKVMDQLEVLTQQGRTLEHAMQYSGHLTHMTPKQVRTLMGQLAPGWPALVVTGDVNALKPQLEKAGYSVLVYDGSGAIPFQAQSLP